MLVKTTTQLLLYQNSKGLTTVRNVCIKRLGPQCGAGSTDKLLQPRFNEYEWFKSPILDLYIEFETMQNL